MFGRSIKTGSFFTGDDCDETPLLNPFSAGVLVVELFKISSGGEPNNATAVESIVTGPFVLTFSSSRTVNQNINNSAYMLVQILL